MRGKHFPKISNVQEFASESALKLAHIMFENASGAREGRDTECVHDMRVASRRLRELLQLFQSIYPKKKRKRVFAGVKKITRILGMPREMDVNLSLLKLHKPRGSSLLLTAHEYLLEIFEFEQDSLRRRMVRSFDKLNLVKLESDLVQFLQTGSCASIEPHLLVEIDERPESAGLLQEASCALQGRVAPIVEQRASLIASRYGDDDELHRLRVCVKKCRYCFELLNPLYQGEFELAVRLARELQDVLGSLHDYGVVIDRLRAQHISLLEKGRQRLSKGCKRLIADLGEIKQSLYPQIEPAHIALLNELSAHPSMGGLEPVESSGQHSEQQVNAEPFPSSPASNPNRSKRADLLAATQDDH